MLGVDDGASSNNLSIAELVAAGREQLANCSDSAKLDAQVLLSFVLDKPTSYLLAWPEKLVSAEIVERFIELVERRLQGEPIAYIVGEREFWSLPLKVSPATLIPRPDTEVLVELVLDHYSVKSSAHSNLRCLDLGTGTGAIALALASEQPNWRVEAIDFNPDAVLLAQSNAKNLAIANVEIYQSDWFSAVNSAKVFDVIVSNPPYIDQDDPHLSQGDVVFEPNSALVAADNGLADIRHIATQAKSYLIAGGRLYIEHGYQQGLRSKRYFNLSLVITMWSPPKIMAVMIALVMVLVLKFYLA